MTSTKKITALEAAEKAKEYYNQVSGYGQDITVEEVELDEEGKYWLITLGIHSQSSVTLRAQGIEKLTSYKQFQVDTVTGEVKSMRIRVINFTNLQSNP